MESYLAYRILSFIPRHGATVPLLHTELKVFLIKSYIDRLLRSRGIHILASSSARIRKILCDYSREI